MDVDVIIIEAIEVLLNYILYLRDIYPEQIFKKMRLYNTPIYINIHPPLTSYMGNILQTCRELLKQNSLHCVEMKIFCDEDTEIKEYESYMLEIKSLTESVTNDDVMLKRFEEEINIALKKITEKLNKFEKLPHNVKFNILLHTTNSAFTKITHTPLCQRFPWINISHDKTVTNTKTMELLPLVSAKSLGLRVHVDIFR